MNLTLKRFYFHGLKVDALALRFGTPGYIIHSLLTSIYACITLVGNLFLGKVLPIGYHGGQVPCLQEKERCSREQYE